MRSRLSDTREMIWSRAHSASAVGACISVFLLTRNAPAAEQTALDPNTPVPQEELSLQAFGSKNLTCVEWNDSCATCRRELEWGSALLDAWDRLSGQRRGVQGVEFIAQAGDWPAARAVAPSLVPGPTKRNAQIQALRVRVRHARAQPCIQG